MPDPFQPVRQGDSLAISARSMNGLLDAGKDRSRRRLNENQTQGGGPGIPQPTRIFNSLTVALGAFNVVQTSISDAELDAAAVPLEAASAPILNALTPAEDGRPFFITREAVPVGGIGEVTTNGPAVVWIDVTDASHTFAKVSAGVTECLVSSASEGAPILWKESGTGLKMAQVMLGGALNPLPLYQINPGASGSLTPTVAQSITLPTGTFLVFTVATGVATVGSPAEDRRIFYGLIAWSGSGSPPGGVSGFTEGTIPGYTTSPSKPLGICHVGRVTNDGSKPVASFVWQLIAGDPAFMIGVFDMFAIPVTVP